MTIIRKIISRLRRRLCPTPHERVLNAWRDSGGDATHRYAYPLDDTSIVLDLGGYEGQWAHEMFTRYRCHVHIFEPVTGFANAIRHRFAENPSIQVHALALGGSDREEEISVVADGSSTFGTTGPRERIHIIDAVKWMRETFADEKRIQLMKLNIEGGEYELLEHLIAAGQMSRFDDVQIQFHDIAPDSRQRMERIRMSLRKTHAPTYQFDFVWENWRRLP